MLFGAFGHIFLAYGLYYGVLVSDFTSYISQSKLFDAQRLKGADGRVFVATGCCSLCDQQIDDGGSEMDGTAAATGNVLKDVIKLQCGHAFHEVCMRGWVIVGKHEVCPACGERVSRRQILLNPWDKPGLVWLNVLVRARPPSPPVALVSSLIIAASSLTPSLTLAPSQDMMRWIVVFNPILVLFLMAVHKLSGDAPMDPQDHLHLQQQQQQQHQVMLQLLNASGSNHT